jgi:hypothetical protein
MTFAEPQQLSLLDMPPRARREMHGHGTRAKTPTYRSWQHMIDRCHRPQSDSYFKYGARGIAVDDRWRYSFEAFLADMGVRPEGTSIDRIDGSKGYFKENCRWATTAQQTQNTRRCKLNPAKAAEIRALKGKESASSVGRRYGVAGNRVLAIWRGHAWRVVE